MSSPAPDLRRVSGTANSSSSCKTKRELSGKEEEPGTRGKSANMSVRWGRGSALGSRVNVAGILGFSPRGRCGRGPGANDACEVIVSLVKPAREEELGPGLAVGPELPLE